MYDVLYILILSVYLSLCGCLCVCIQNTKAIICVRGRVCFRQSDRKRDLLRHSKNVKRTYAIIAVCIEFLCISLNNLSWKSCSKYGWSILFSYHLVVALKNWWVLESSLWIQCIDTDLKTLHNKTINTHIQ